MDISLKQTFDPDLIASIMSSEAVLSKASNQVLDNIAVEVSDKSGWFLGYHEGRLIGIINAKHFNANTLDIHPYSFDPKTSREFIKAFFKLFLKFPDHVVKIQCFIPDYFIKTINFARKLGFIDEGYLKNSYNRDNKLYGVCVLGITRQEIEVYLNGRNS